MEEETIKETWNMSLAYLRRIDELLTSCVLYQARDDVLGWYRSLYGLYKEIFAKLTKDEKKEAVKLIDNLTKLKNDALKDGQIIRVKPFVEFELFLRQKLEDRNMITPKTDLSGL